MQVFRRLRPSVPSDYRWLLGDFELTATELLSDPDWVSAKTLISIEPNQEALGAFLSSPRPNSAG